MTTPKTRTAIGGALLAGGLLLAGPAAIALADGTTGSTTTGSSTTDPGNGVNGRPPLPFNAPGVNKTQEKGDKYFDNPANSYINGSGIGALYHGLYGSSLTAAKADDPKATAGSQGLVGGAPNFVHRTPTCNIVIQTGC